MILKPHSALWTKIRIGRCRQSFETKRTVMVVVLSFWIGMTCLPARHTRAQPLRRSLAGTWAFRLDPQDIGAQQRWFDEDLTQPIQLPGSMQAQGFGDDVTVDTEWTGDIIDKSWFTDPKYEQFRQPGNVKVPFWLQPEKHYVGAAWYQRTVKIPEDWQGKRLTLHLERCHWETTVWVDGRRIGAAKSLSTPHLYDLSQGPRPRRITIRVDNRVKVNVGPNAHSISDHTQSNWNGIVGRIELAATDRVWVDDVRVYPNIDQKLAKLKIAIGNLTGSGGRGELRVQAEAYNSQRPHRVDGMTIPIEIHTGESTLVETEYPLGRAVQLWGEFDPALYRLTVELAAVTGADRHADKNTTVFGMREISTKGTQFVLNGRPIYLRGTLECAIFPLTGYPPTDVDSWKRVIRTCQRHGLNHIRFHSHCPPQAAFVAADELGFYFHVECAAWANQGSGVGDGEPIDQWLYDEAARILREYGNHPSFVLMAYGNEPGGKNQMRWLGDFVDHWKEVDPRRLYTSGAGWPVIPESQFHNTPAPRIQQWGAGLKSRINARPPETNTDYRDYVNRFDVPVIAHEIGQWCAYPNFDEISKYRGVLKAKNFEIFRHTLRKNHLGDQSRDFLMASGKLQTLCYKEEIESALRTPGLGGFQLLDLHDFPGQGTALIGVLDPFWDSKPYVTSTEFRRFCGKTVPLARLKQRVFTPGEPLQAGVEMAHFGSWDLSHAVVTWKIISDKNQVVDAGQWPPRTIAAGRLNTVGEIDAALSTVVPPRKLELVVGVDGTDIENDWDVWVYPHSVELEASGRVVVTAQLDHAARDQLRDGGKVLLLPDPQRVRGDVAIGFSSIFWNTAWTRGQAPHTLGILCDPQHPALAAFPTEYHSNWQWWELVSRSGAMVLDDMPPQLRPIVQVIDTWFENRRLGLVFEAQVGGGKLLVCTIDLQNDLDQRPVARQLRHSLLKYMSAEQFRPRQELTIKSVVDLFQ